jgi:hypothetical protein
MSGHRNGSNSNVLNACIVLPRVACDAGSACRTSGKGIAVVIAGITRQIICTRAGQGSVGRFVRAGTAGGVAATKVGEAPAISGVAGSLDLVRTR